MSAPACSLLKNPQSHGLHDALGSVRAITDSSGTVVGSYTYGAWGEILSASEPSGFTMPFKFVGGWGVRHDPSTGLYYMRQRWYDGANLQRFLSRDPLAPKANLYHYAENAPVNYTDPTGEQAGVAPMPLGWGADFVQWAIGALEGGIAIEILVGLLLMTIANEPEDTCDPDEVKARSRQRARERQQKHDDQEICVREWEADIAWCDRLTPRQIRNAGATRPGGKLEGYRSVAAHLRQIKRTCREVATERLAACLRTADGNPTPLPGRYPF